MLKVLIRLFLFFPFVVGAQTAFISGNDTICDNANPAVVKIEFSGSAPFTFIYEIDGVAQGSINIQNTPYLIYTKTPGVYTLKSFNDAVSVGTTSGSALVTVLQAPTAIIHVLSDTISALNPKVDFVSNSLGNIVQQIWNFGDNTADVVQNNPTYTYPIDTNGIGIVKTYEPYLLVKDDKGCVDTAVHQIWVRDEHWIYIPTAFTPDNDTKNDKFCIGYNAVRIETFLFKVYNTQGDLMFQTATPASLSCKGNGGWNGKHYKTGKDLPADTYIYEVYYQDFEGWKYQDYGTIILVR